MNINGAEINIPKSWQNESLLRFLRDNLGLTGTKYGCGKGICGACTVHIDGNAVRACVTPINAVGDAHVTTIEGLATQASLHPVQEAWIELNVPQCGYCQPGQIMTAAAFLATNANPTEEEVTHAMNGNLCRCGTYPRIKAGVLRAAEIAGEEHE
ncbi:MAG: (2Fe-2S)-binding protein [Pseudomonadota bacterium]